MKFWPFPILRNYRTSATVDGILSRVATDPQFALKESDMHHATVSTSFGEVSFWTANKFYAYASEGCAKAKNGRTVVWKDEMPSRATVRALYRRVEKARSQIVLGFE